MEKQLLERFVRHCLASSCGDVELWFFTDQQDKLPLVGDIFPDSDDERASSKLALEVLLTFLQTGNWYLPTAPSVIEAVYRFARHLQINVGGFLATDVIPTIRMNHLNLRGAEFWSLSREHKSSSIRLSNFGMIASKENDHGHRFVIGNRPLRTSQLDLEELSFAWEIRVLEIGDASLSYNFILLGICEHVPNSSQSHLDRGVWGFASNSRVYRSGMVYDGEVIINERDVLQMILNVCRIPDEDEEENGRSGGKRRRARSISLTLMNLSKSATFCIDQIVEPEVEGFQGFYPYVNILAANAKILMLPINPEVAGTVTTTEEQQYADELEL
eukprot:TRINITY_DN5366_c0_g1_i7.p1 TRINITY_DN5366_c0_g1~~TRINITY_DN5366_c0_g1_i7.p1  ORF type:complete len:330 (-),score=80.26 TRINITY_DN5366_c0_g1_i7:76-1065(-)